MNLKDFKEVDFMTAITTWDTTSKTVVCIYRQNLMKFTDELNYRSEMKLHGGMILDGKWYIEK